MSTERADDGPDSPGAALGPRAFQARWVFPVEGPPLADGFVSVEAGRVTAVGRHAAADALDLGNVAILPGLINAHTHLEFSDLEQPLGKPGLPLPDWIRSVVEYRRGHSAAARAAVERGLDESLRCGTTSLGEIATPRWPSDAFAGCPLNVTEFLELIGLTAGQAPPRLEAARQHLARPAGARWRPGLSPHAPYTVHPNLLAGAIQLAKNQQAPLAFHLAESHEELELLQTGSGPLGELLSDLGAWDPTAIRPGTRPLDFLRLLAQGHRSLVIHGNYLDDEELAFCAAHADRLSVVYCPRTHAYFGHARHPIAWLLGRGASVALGTDSRASNPDLSVLEEMRFVARHISEISPQVVLELGTRRGAAALGQAEAAGSLQPGKAADLAVVRLPERPAQDPFELLFDSTEPIVAAMCGGQWSISGPDCAGAPQA